MAVPPPPNLCFFYLSKKLAECVFCEMNESLLSKLIGDILLAEQKEIKVEATKVMRCNQQKTYPSIHSLRITSLVLTRYQFFFIFPIFLYLYAKNFLICLKSAHFLCKRIFKPARCKTETRVEKVFTSKNIDRDSHIWGGECVVCDPT